jgi:poly-gamma-glutamate synthesis protein (capsule biosynthesis protein)
MQRDGKAIRLLAMGDIMMGDHPICIGHGVRSTIAQRSHKYLFESVRDLLQQGDIVFANLEAVLSHANLEKGRLESIQLRGEPESALDLEDAGFTVISVANNHMMEHGELAFRETVELLRVHNIMPVGLRSEGPMVCKPAFISSHGERVMFLAYSMVPDIRSAENLPYCLASEQQILSDTMRARASCEVVVVSLHWGYEFMDRPSPKQMVFARRLIDAGATIVLGHHSHVFQCVERYRQGMIAYSLGNFVFDMWQSPMRQSGVLQCEVAHNGVRDFFIHPVQIEQCRPLLIYEEDTSPVAFAHKRLPLKVVRSEEVMTDYLEEARKMRMSYRQDVWKYFLANLHRYSPSLAIQLALSPLRKLSKRGQRGR